VETRGDIKARASEPLWTLQFLLLLVISLCFFSGFQLVTVTVPLLAVDLGGGNASAGVVLGAFTLAAIIVRPVTGWALDAYGRRVLFLLGTVICVAGILAYEFVAGVAFLLVLRFVHGAGFGMTTTASGTVASDMVPRSRLGEGMGFFTLAMSVPMAFAPTVGLAFAGGNDFTSLFLLAGGLTAVSLLLSVMLKIPRRRRTGARLSPTALLERTSLFPAVMMLLLTTTYGSILAFIALYGREKDIANVGPFFTVYAVVLAIARPLSGRMADKFGYERTAAVGTAMAAVGLLILATADSLTMFMVAAFMYGLGFGTAHPSLQALVIYLVSPSRRGAATATFFTAFDVGVAIGSVGGGLFAGILGLSGVYILSTIAAAAATCCLVVYTRRRPPTAPPRAAVEGEVMERGLT